MPDEHELVPKYDARQFFSRKARVRKNDLGDVGLFSYDMPVCWIDVKTQTFHRVWDGWSSATGRHVVEFARQHPYEYPKPQMLPTKTVWDGLPVEEVPPFMR